MSKGKNLQKRHDTLRDQWFEISKAIDILEEVNTYEISTNLNNTITKLRINERVFGKSLDIVNKEIKKYQKECPHDKKEYTGHCHKWDHFKCDECGKNFEE